MCMQVGKIKECKKLLDTWKFDHSVLTRMIKMISTKTTVSNIY